MCCNLTQICFIGMWLFIFFVPTISRRLNILEKSDFSDFFKKVRLIEIRLTPTFVNSDQFPIPLRVRLNGIQLYVILVSFKTKFCYFDHIYLWTRHLLQHSGHTSKPRNRFYHQPYKVGPCWTPIDVFYQY